MNLKYNFHNLAELLLQTYLRIRRKIPQAKSFIHRYRVRTYIILTILIILSIQITQNALLLFVILILTILYVFTRKINFAYFILFLFTLLLLWYTYSELSTPTILFNFNNLPDKFKQHHPGITEENLRNQIINEVNEIVDHIGNWKRERLDPQGINHPLSVFERILR